MWPIPISCTDYWMEIETKTGLRKSKKRCCKFLSLGPVKQMISKYLSLTLRSVWKCIRSKSLYSNLPTYHCDVYHNRYVYVFRLCVLYYILHTQWYRFFPITQRCGSDPCKVIIWILFALGSWMNYYLLLLRIGRYVRALLLLSYHNRRFRIQ